MARLARFAWRAFPCAIHYGEVVRSGQAARVSRVLPLRLCALRLCASAPLSPNREALRNGAPCASAPCACAPLRAFT